jgi:hypothetical protein
MAKQREPAEVRRYREAQEAKQKKDREGLMKLVKARSVSSDQRPSSINSAQRAHAAQAPTLSCWKSAVLVRGIRKFLQA